MGQKYVYCIGLLCLLGASCTGRFEEYNRDDTGFTDEQQAYDFGMYGIPLRVVQQGIYFNHDWGGGKNWPFQVMQNLGADMFCGYMHDYKPFDAGLGNSVYHLNDGWNGAMWENTYGYILTEVKKAEDLTRGNVPAFYAVSQILKVELMHRVSDIYGPVVYTRFGQSVVSVMPDTQKEAYYAFFDDLEEAVRLLSADDGKEAFARFDMIMPKGKRTYRQWVKFANSLRLRLAVRIAMADPRKALEEAGKSLDAANGGLLEQRDDLVAVSTAGTGYSNPLGEINTAWKEASMNANMESILGGYEDPRMPKYFEPATGEGFSGEFRGIRQGTGFNHTKYIRHSRSTVTQTSDAVLMTAAEAWFLRAEAALRGWSDEEAAYCYRKGVEASFGQWGVEGAAAYLESGRTARDFTDTFDPSYSIKACCRVSPKWDESAPDEVKLEKIITQKWIACYPEGCEAWAEQRRTGYPRLFPVLLNKSEGKIDTGIMIRRLNFPVSLKTSDPPLYEALCNALRGQDTGGTRLWWDTGRNF
ncbi:MAG: SusD/RagB family nutrient-binding outer membrane lipoprotein [Tannerellaceae bacterium]|jgi:hypothetical protein|nr:SusD/RagB family nutrient-binding outer membrane lipoprotein [Tannerellaceae bacterium]